MKHRKDGRTKTIEFNTYKGMQRRCYEKNNPKYPDYGGRGIKVCDRWLGLSGFANFLSDVGRRPGLNYSLNRIDNDGDYEPSNCEWATPHQQSANKRSNAKTVGVSYHKAHKLWVAHLQKDNKVVFHKYFKTETEAIKARKQAEKTYLLSGV